MVKDRYFFDESIIKESYLPTEKRVSKKSSLRIKSLLDSDLSLNTCREKMLAMTTIVIKDVKTDEQRLVIAHILIDLGLSYLGKHILNQISLVFTRKDEIIPTLRSLYESRITLKIKE